jgi:hypothetical protein
VNFNGPSVVVGLLAGVVALAIAVFGNMQWPRVVAGLTLTSVAGLLNGTIGPVISGWVTRADQLVGSVIGRFTGVAVTGVLAVAVCAFLAFRVWQNNIDFKTLTAAGLAPATAVLIPGTVGAVFVAVVGAVAAFFAMFIRALFFGW